MMQNKHSYKNILLFSGMVFLFTLLVTAFAWNKIPSDAPVPLHWNINGEVDRYGTKTVGLFFAPVLILLLTALLTFAPRLEPRLENLQQSQKAYRIVWGGILAFMAIIHLITVLAVLGYPVHLPMLMAFLVGILFMAIGNYMGKIRSNFMFGIRTPWTLSSENVWNKTHRIGGRLFFLVGLCVFLSGFSRRGELIFGFLTLSLLGVVLFLYGYSYWIWKQDKERKNA
jgi:uncharacterized membrane protein